MSTGTALLGAPAAPALRIGPLVLPSPVVLAPMAGVTDAAFRTLCRRYGDGLYVNEMVMARALAERNARTRTMVRFAPGEWPRSVQCYGTDPTEVAAAVEILIGEHGVDHVDLNFGCPAAKVTRKGGGAALPVRRVLLARVISAAVEPARPAGVPVTVKFRMGVDDDHRTDTDTARAAVDAGAAAVALHARTAEQLYAGQADWSAITRLVETVDGAVPVLGNGDVFAGGDGPRMMAETGCDGIVVGRGCLGRPWLFADLADAFAGRPVAGDPDLGTVADALVTHAQLLFDLKGDTTGCRDLRKHTAWYLKGYPVGPETRQAFARVTSLDEVEARCAALDRTAGLDREAAGLVRGHTNGPRRPVVPEGWFDNLEDPTPPRGAGGVTSGG